MSIQPSKSLQRRLCRRCPPEGGLMVSGKIDKLFLQRLVHHRNKRLQLEQE